MVCTWLLVLGVVCAVCEGFCVISLLVIWGGMKSVRCAGFEMLNLDGAVCLKKRASFAKKISEELRRRA